MTTDTEQDHWILYFLTLQCILELVITKQLVKYALMQVPQGLT